MKLSEMNTKQLTKALCDLTSPIANICGDKEVMDALSVLRKVQHGESVGSIADVIAKVVPVLLDKHYDDAVAILSALTGKSRKEIDEQSGVQTINDIMACMDGDLSTFFTPSAPMDENPSSAQSTPTERPQELMPFLPIWQSVKKKLSGKSTLRK